MINIIRADLYKIRKSIAMKVLFIMTFVCSIIMAVMSNAIASGSISTDYSGIGFLFSDANMTSILGAVIAAIFICGDFDNKIISTEISSGNSRMNIVCGKMISYLISVFIIMLPYIVVSVVGAAISTKFDMGASVGYLHLLQSTGDSVVSLNELFRLLLISVIMLVVYLAQFSLCVPLAFKVKKPVLVVAIYYVVTIIIAQISNLATKSDTLDNIYSLTPFGGNYLFFNLSSSILDMVKAVIVSIIFAAVVMMITFLLFRKQEVK